VKRRRNIIVALLALAAIAAFALAAYGGPQEASKAAAKPAAKPAANDKAPSPAAAPKAPAPKPVDAAADKARLALPVAKIDGVEISLGYLETALDRQSPLLRKELADAVKRKDFLDKMLNMEVLATEAQRRGFSTDPEVASVKATVRGKAPEVGAAVKSALSNERQVVELVGIIATYNMVSRLLVALDVEPERT
jgi:hypothetical protein